MGGAQFALPGAVERLRAGRSPSGRTGQGGAGQGSAADEGARTLVLAAADPAQPYGAALPWPKREGQTRRPARVAGAYVVLVEDEPVLYVERGGRGLVRLGDAPAGGAAVVSGVGAPAAAGGGDEALAAALATLARAVRAGRVGKLALERIDGESAIASELAETLVELGFHPGPRKLTLSA
jgi:ATP-dependent helicase Lhr and Lhr-like helicase